MPYKVAVEYWRKSVPPGVIEREVIAAVTPELPASNCDILAVALFSPTPSAEITFEFEPV